MNKPTGVALAVVTGLAVAVQSRINGELGHRLGDGIVAAAISFGSGLIMLLFLLGRMRPGLRALRAALRDGSLLWWHCLGGVCGAFLVATQGLTVAALGVAVFSVALVAGQTTSSLAVDRAGLVPGGPHPITRNRALGAFLCLVSVVVAVAGHFGDPKRLGLAVLPALGGIGIAWQQGVNGLVRQAAGSALPATFVNFSVGTAALLVVLGIDLAVRGVPGPLPYGWWLYVGGLLGIVFIALATVVVARIGVLVMGLSMVAGQICGALVLDTLYPTPSGKPTGQTVLAAALALGAIVLAALPARASTPVSTTPQR